MDPRICVAPSLHCSSETITTLLIGCTPIQNVFGVKKKVLLLKNFIHSISNLKTKGRYSPESVSLDSALASACLSCVNLTLI